MERTWNSTISFGSTEPKLTINEAAITLDGPLARFPAIDSLANNSGTFQVIGGRSFITSASYSNSGRTVVGTSSALSITGDLDNTGTIDVGGIVIINKPAVSSLTAVASQVASGFAGGLWNGIGIDSSPAALNTDMHKTGVGYAVASDLGMTGGGTFAGQSVNDTSVIVRYTLIGDSNLDAQVNALDFNALATHYGNTAAVWSDGDFNYDGVVNALDFTVMASNFDTTLPSTGEPLGALIPEPAVSALIAISLLCVARRRRIASAAG